MIRCINYFSNITIIYQKKAVTKSYGYKYY